MKNMKTTLFLFALLGLALLLAGCTQPASPVNNTPAGSGNVTPAAGTAAVVIKDFSFQPSTLTIKAGTMVTWTNQDSAPHTIKISEQSSPTMATGQTYSQKFDTAGTYEYSCGIHPSMKGTIIVQ
ncbi:MAG: cupredoxin family copper-binding protein [Candidatus Micrarchaeota archaeon]